MNRKFRADPDYSTKRSDRFGETCLYIVKHEDLAHTEAYLSPEFLREYSLTQGFEIEPLRSPGGTQAFLLEQWGSYYLLLAYQREAVFMIRVDDLDDTDRILGIVSRSYLSLKTLDHHPPGYQLLLDFDIVDIWGNETTDQWSITREESWEFTRAINQDLTGRAYGTTIQYETTTMEVYKWIYVLFKMYSELL